MGKARQIRESVLPLLSAMLTALLVAVASMPGLAAAAAEDALAAFSTTSGVPPTTQILPLLYVKNVITKILLSNYGKDPEIQLRGLEQIEEILKKFAAQPHQIYQAESLAEFHSLQARMFPPVWDLQDEVQNLQHDLPPYILVSTQSADVLAEIDALLEAQTTLPLPPLLKLQTATLEAAFRKITKRPDLAANFFNLLPIEVKREGLKQFDSLLVAPQIDKINHLGTLIAASGSVHLEDQSWEKFFQIVIGEYFSQLDLPSKLNMVAALADTPTGADQMTLFSTLVLNSGPQFQKFFQIYARQPGFSDSLKKVFVQLEQSTKPVPWRLVKPVIEAEKVPFEWLEIAHEPLGIGTMAQVHLASIRLKDGSVHKVIVRLFKPNNSERLKKDNAAFTEVIRKVDNDPTLRAANFPLISPFINQLAEMAEKESILSNTVSAQLKAAPIYERTTPLIAGGFSGQLHVRVPSLYDLGPESKIMVQEFVEGTSFEKFTEQSPEVAKAAVISIAEEWLEIALTGNGFFHADLHQGNLRVKQVGNMVTVNLLDFGMTGQISESMQNRFMAFGLSMGAKDADLMARVIWEMSLKDENEISLEKLKVIFQNELDREKAANLAEWPLYEWVSLCINSGVRFPSEFTTLNRGSALVARMLEDYGLPSDFGGRLKKILLKNPARIARLLADRDVLKLADWYALIKGTLSGSSVVPVEPAAKRSPASPPSSEMLCRDLFSQTPA